MLDFYENNNKNNLDLAIYCINLDYRPDRWLLIKNEYNKFCRKIYRIPSYKIKDNIVSCACSFLKCILLAKLNNMETILICEDDTQFTKKSKKIWTDSINELPNEWDILLGGVSSYYKPNNFKNNTKNIIKVGDFSGEHMMLINKKAYNKLLTYFNYNIKHFDRFLGYLSKHNMLNIYCCNPFVSLPILRGYSNIRNKLVDDTLIYKLSEQKIKNLLINYNEK